MPSFAKFVAEQQPSPRHLALLTRRQAEVFNLKYEGYENSDIARQLNVTVGTVRTHLRCICRRLDAYHRIEAADTAQWFDER
jgi:two-component system nitrate/nitrite response regulator NarL